MKKVLVGILILTMICCFAGCGDASGENVEIVRTTDNTVYFKPVCPECGHIESTESINLCEGEDYSTRSGCSECYKFYDISIER